MLALRCSIQHYKKAWTLPITSSTLRCMKIVRPAGNLEWWSFNKLRGGCGIEPSVSLGLLREKDTYLLFRLIPLRQWFSNLSVHQIPGGLVKAQITEPHSQNLKFSRCWMRPKNLHSNKFPGDADALRTILPSCIRELGCMYDCDLILCTWYRQKLSISATMLTTCIKQLLSIPSLVCLPHDRPINLRTRCWGILKDDAVKMLHSIC